MKNQKGVTFVGMVFIAGMIIFAAIIGIKLIPAYIEYAGIVNHLRDIARSPEARGASPRDIQVMFDKRAQIDDIKAVTGQDLDIERDADSLVISARYSTRISLFGNVSACIDFNASSGN